MNKRIIKLFLYGLMIFKILAVGFSITAYKTVIETAYCVPLYYAILIKFYVPMYIQQNKRIKAIL